jgi:hypothetical protein
MGFHFGMFIFYPEFKEIKIDSLILDREIKCPLRGENDNNLRRS